MHNFNIYISFSKLCLLSQWVLYSIWYLLVLISTTLSYFQLVSIIYDLWLAFKCLKVKISLALIFDIIDGESCCSAAKTFHESITLSVCVRVEAWQWIQMNWHQVEIESALKSAMSTINIIFKTLDKIKCWSQTDISSNDTYYKICVPSVWY
jgi:hypothetical protein